MGSQFSGTTLSSRVEDSASRSSDTADRAGCVYQTMVGLLLLGLAMDPDIKQEFDIVHREIQSAREQVAEVDIRLREVDSRLSEVDARLSGKIHQAETALRQEIREEGTTTRRHFDVIAESLRDDIRILAEGFIALDAKFERMRESR
jgi:hypothetical protein